MEIKRRCSDALRTRPAEWSDTFVLFRGAVLRGISIETGRLGHLFSGREMTMRMSKFAFLLRQVP
jgi:hypothetical protein